MGTSSMGIGAGRSGDEAAAKLRVVRNVDWRRCCLSANDVLENASIDLKDGTMK